jgi:diguanylate cyclase (GGDEF)-like protein
MAIDWLSWLECAGIPVVIGIPMGYFIFSQTEKLQLAHAQLSKSHCELKEAHDRLAFVTNYDRMTGLLNREGFLTKAEALRGRNETHMLLVIDPDNFRRINDHYGHAKGDESLARIGKAIQYAVRPKDIVGRIGGEEFGVLLVATGVEEARQVADLIRRQVLCIPWQSEDANAPRLAVSIGGAVLNGTTDVADVLRLADRCVVGAKHQGRNRVAFDCQLRVAAA